MFHLGHIENDMLWFSGFHFDVAALRRFTFRRVGCAAAPQGPVKLDKRICAAQLRCLQREPKNAVQA